MQSLNNLFPHANGHEKHRRPAMHFAWQPGTSGFRIMALLEDGSTMLVCLVANRHDIRAKGEEAENEIAEERNRNAEELRANGRSQGEGRRPSFVSLYTERWVGKLTAGSWQPMSDKEGGCYRAFRRQAATHSGRRGRNGARN